MAEDNYVEVEPIDNLKKCPFCGEMISVDAVKCRYCGEWFNAGGRKMNNVQRNVQRQQVIIQEKAKKVNGIGIAGFILSILSFCFSWSAVVGIVLWVLGFIFSFAGMFKRPRGLAIAGFVISSITLIVILLVVGVLATIVSKI